MAIGSSFIDEIKSKVNIVDVIGREVPLKQSGSNFKGLCPFHNEKTPSFMVNEQKQIFNCFGCGEKGDVIHFVQRFNNMEFMEACEKLAEEYNIEIPKHGKKIYLAIMRLTLQLQDFSLITSRNMLIPDIHIFVKGVLVMKLLNVLDSDILQILGTVCINFYKIRAYQMKICLS